ncbi:hypothetical protein [Salidesulfovibrio brasiliensis]|uniref:hypothetical protein n=1 Tax=Salidesulfovibrio brasiliensis TaxID=221711 RepID=UPI0006D11393|nr:hypothetical protein [Salidesulfovibrio brasiliensis]
MADSYLEKALGKLARQLNAYDEASLMNLWEKYAEKVRQFEPTRRWEEDAIVFCLLQSMRLKNQLFNHRWSESRAPEPEGGGVDLTALTAPAGRIKGDFVSEPPATGQNDDTGDDDHKGKVLRFKPREE